MARISSQHGKPVIVHNGSTLPIAAYSPSSRPELGIRTMSAFFRHGMSIYFLNVPRVQTPPDRFDFSANPFWVGDRISSDPMLPLASESLDEQADAAIHGDPGAMFFIRFGIHEPRTWREAHRDQLFVDERGRRHETPSLASKAYWRDAGRYAAAVIAHCEARPWADRILGYANFLREEGSHHPLIEGWLFDHGPTMTHAYREFLQKTYGTSHALRRAHADPDLRLDQAPVPRDAFRAAPDAAWSRLYWQEAWANQPLRDYLEVTRQAFHAGFTHVTEMSRQAAGPDRVLLYDGLKQVMQGWTNFPFFNPESSWPAAYHDMLAGAGHIAVADLLQPDGVDGLITPHDYQARGIGGVYEPEGPADSLVLRGKLMLCEMDTRTYHGAIARYAGGAADDRQFAAITWRNLATSWTRGFDSYWMDVFDDWFSGDSLQSIIGQQVRAIRQAIHWPHRTVPGIAVILDDAAVLETNGNGNYFNESIMWEMKMGLARCGVPVRTYLLQDLALDGFPEHRVFYFPNLFRVDDQRLALLRDKVFRDGHAVVWGPGSGISDGRTIGPEHAAALTGFNFEGWTPSNDPRRTLITRYDHPITRHVDPSTIIGGPLPYGPVVHPADGESLGMAWCKNGITYSGLSVKSFGRGAGAMTPGRGPGDWASMFTTAVPLPATLWRGLAEFAGAHVYCDTGDVLMASASVVALHSVKSGAKRIALPEVRDVHDVIADAPFARHTDSIEFEIQAPETRVFRLTSPAS